MAKKNDTFYIDENIWKDFKRISIESMISKNNLLSQVLKDFIDYYNLTGKVKREI